jgi:hypothetical protein
MTLGRKSANVDADLGNNDLCTHALDTGNRCHEFDCGLKGCEIRLHLLVDRGDGRIESIDLIKMKAQQEAMVIRNAATQRLAQVLL